MAYADPDKQQAYWAANGWKYRGRSRVRLAPVSRQQCLDEDLEQQAALAVLEARRIGRERAEARLKAYAEEERRWIRVTYSPNYEVT